jgi:thioredoxin reductase (NADPH)
VATRHGAALAPDSALFVVLDDEQSLQLLRRDLERRYGKRFQVLGALSGRSALEALTQARQDAIRIALVLAHQRLRDMTAVEILERVAALCPGARRVLLSPYAEAESAIEAVKAARIDHCLIEPWQPAETNLYPALDDLLADWEASSPSAFAGLTVIGYRFSPESHQTRDFLVRNCVPFQWLDVERDEQAARLLAASGLSASQLPIVRFPDGSQLVRPSNVEIAERIGLKVRPQGAFYDLVIVGGGPAGLAASVYAASEGLRTVMVERHAPGGQAGLSSMIENYLGFPAGLSGADLARRAVVQARKFAVEIVTPQTITGLRVENSLRVTTLADGTELRCHAVLLAVGVEWRRLDVPGLDALIGAGVYYGGTVAEAFLCRNEDVCIVGGANSAGQAALHFSRYARTVTLLVRADSLSKSMSKYLIEQIEATKNVKVFLRTTVVSVQGRERLEAVTVRNAAGESKTLATSALFIFIGALPHTEVFASALERDGHGFILTGPDLGRAGGDCGRPRNWPLDRDPFWLETSVPGVFAAGDARHGSVKRVAAGVGEGATAVQFIHQYLDPSAHGAEERAGPGLGTRAQRLRSTTK